MVSKPSPPLNFKSRGIGGGDLRIPARAADWDYWEQMPSAQLWQAVALSLDWEPDSVIPLTSQVSFDFLRQRSPKIFQSRLDLAEKCLLRGEIPTAQREASTPHSEVDLKPFATWAASIGWDIPVEFPRENEQAPKAKRLGRPDGSPYAEADAFLVERMKAIHDDNPDWSAAKLAREISDEISGDGTRDNKERRLVRKYKSTYPD